MKFRNLLLAGLAIVSVVAFTGCGQKADNAEVPKKVVVGLDDSFPPMGFRDEQNNIVGFDIDVAKEVAKRSGIEIEFKPIDWSSKEAELKGKKIDALWNGLTITEDRKKNILFSDPYMDDKELIVTRADDKSITSKESLAGKTVGVQTASSGEAYLKADPASKAIKEVKTYDDFVAAFNDLELGRIDAVIADGVVARYTLTKKTGLKIVEGPDFGADIFAVGFRKEDTALKNKIDQVLIEMKKDGTMDKIAQKWFGTAADLDKSDAK